MGNNREDRYATENKEGRNYTSIGVERKEKCRSYTHCHTFVLLKKVLNLIQWNQFFLFKTLFEKIIHFC